MLEHMFAIANYSFRSKRVCFPGFNELFKIMVDATASQTYDTMTGDVWFQLTCEDTC